MKTKKQDQLEKLVVNLLLENQELKEEVEKQKESSMYWYKEFDKQKELYTDLQNRTLAHLDEVEPITEA